MARKQRKATPPARVERVCGSNATVWELLKFLFGTDSRKRRQQQRQKEESRRVAAQEAFCAQCPAKGPGCTVNEELCATYKREYRERQVGE